MTNPFDSTPVAIHQEIERWDYNILGLFDGAASISLPSIFKIIMWRAGVGGAYNAVLDWIMDDDAM